MKKKNVAIIGLGYVGLPLALLCAKKGYDVLGVDLDQEKVDLINKGISQVEDAKLRKGLIKATTVFGEIEAYDNIIIAVPTPVDEKHIPDLQPLISAVKEVARFFKTGKLIVVESTIFPGTTEEVVLPVLNDKGIVGEDFYLAHCPERIDPGNKKWNVGNLPRVVGGVTDNCLKKAYTFYKTILSNKITKLSSVKAAEATKIMENTFRDINIAYMNEMARSFDKLGIDITEVIKGASSKPFAFMPHYPGCGVGGHCIPVDPYYLIEKAKEIGFTHSFLNLAREINSDMPKYTVQLLENEVGTLKEKKIGLLGLSYKKDVDDTRESPALVIHDILKKKEANVAAYDPFVKSSAKSFIEVLKKSDYLILATNHSEFKKINSKLLLKNKIKAVIDGRNFLDKKDIQDANIFYKGIGR